MAEPKWKRFEKVIHDIHAQLAPEGASVTMDDKIVGSESGVERQIDVSIRVNIAGYDILIVIECKDQGRPIDVTGMGSFTSLVKDVNANKGVMISSSGYTEAALNMAKARSIEIRTYVDTESTDWRSEVAIPVLLDRIKLKSFAFRFSSVPGHRMVLSTTGSIADIEMFAEDGSSLGTIWARLARKWNAKEVPHTPGEHTVELSKDAIIDVRGQKSHIRIDALVRVERLYYLGPVPIKVVGLMDEHTGSLRTREIMTEGIEPAVIERGDLPGWEQIPNIDELSIRPVIRMGYVDVQPEHRSEPKPS